MKFLALFSFLLLLVAVFAQGWGSSQTGNLFFFSSKNSGRPDGQQGSQSGSFGGQGGQGGQNGQSGSSNQNGQNQGFSGQGNSQAQGFGGDQAGH